MRLCKVLQVRAKTSNILKKTNRHGDEVSHMRSKVGVGSSGDSGVDGRLLTHRATHPEGPPAPSGGAAVGKCGDRCMNEGSGRDVNTRTKDSISERDKAWGKIPTLTQELSTQ